MSKEKEEELEVKITVLPSSEDEETGNYKLWKQRLRTKQIGDDYDDIVYPEENIDLY